MNGKCLKEIICIIMLTTCFTIDICTLINININWAYSIMAIIVLLAFIKYVFGSNSTKNNIERNIINSQLIYNFMPKVIIYIYTLFLVFSGLTEKRFLSTNLQTFVNGLSAISVFILFGKQSFYYSYIAVVLSYIITISVEVFNKGLNICLEFHDLAFSMGYVILFILYKKKAFLKREFKILFFTSFIVFAAGKRIELFALFLTIIWLKFASKLSERKKKRFIFYSGICMIGICFLFIQFVMTPELLSRISSAFSIDLSGRNYYYAALQPYVKKGVSFWGLGRNAVQVIMTQDFPWLHVGNVHSDIYRMYAECGFIIFGGWVIWYLIGMQSVAIKKYGTHVGEFSFILTCYTFIVYFTDNTELYLMNQYFYVLTMLTFMYSQVVYDIKKTNSRIEGNNIGK